MSKEKLKASSAVKKDSVSQRDWLDLSWKYFQQHAQQRISYFNFFVIFSTILTTGLVSTFQKSFGPSYFATPIGILQCFLAYMFLKLDQRNKFLTKHAEETIMHIEKTDVTAIERGIQLFLSEDDKFKKENNKLNKICKIPSHGNSYKTIYIAFMIWGALGGLSPFINSYFQTEPKPQQIEASVNFNYSKLDSLGSEILKRDSIAELLFNEVKILSMEIDSLAVIFNKKRK